MNDLPFALSSYHYHLPEELIAQEAIHPHHDARLMIIDRSSGDIIDESTFWQLDTIIPRDRVVFFNNSRVLRARIRLENIDIENSRGMKSHIQDGEILFCQKSDTNSFEALVRPGNKFKIGTKIFLGENILEVISMTENGRLISMKNGTIEEIMEQYGELPLPPYITYEKSKEADYQTVFAEKNGSVAAPTASLHFTDALLAKLPHEKLYTTLHVGLGTFKGVDTEDIRDYHIHSERVEVDISLFGHIARLKNQDQKILAVGTTVCRTLESLPYVWQMLVEEERSHFDTDTTVFWDTLTRNLTKENYISHITFDFTLYTLHFDTTIFLYPGKQILLVDDLITNFHLPESSLLMLVSTFVSRDALLEIYRKAIEGKYQFFSFGDGMYIRGS